MLRQLLKPFTRNVAQRGGRAYHAPAEFKPGTMDELPIPQGSWQQYYDNKQKSYNLQLAFGVVYFVSTMTYIISTGAIYLNWGPPVPKDQKKWIILIYSKINNLVSFNDDKTKL